MINYKIFFQLMVTVFKEKLIATPVVLGFYLKQNLFQNKLQRTDLEPC